jgi:23S rRNA pseudouridine1911/1915/1917 synthase
LEPAAVFGEAEQTQALFTRRAAPYVLAVEPSYLVLFKPPRFHSVPLRCSDQASSAENLLDWCAVQFPELRSVRGNHPWEGGILHRLDYAAQGLILAARTQAALEAFSAQQRAGLFAKDYIALSAAGDRSAGFPHKPLLSGAPRVIESGFRPFGPGRKAVRPAVFPDASGLSGKAARKPALDQGKPYRTAIIETRGLGPWVRFKLRLRRGFRHQIRCHLAWIGYPILNDALYGGAETNGTLCLQCYGLSFLNPGSGLRAGYSL